MRVTQLHTSAGDRAFSADEEPEDARADQAVRPLAVAMALCNNAEHINVVGPGRVQGIE